MIDYKGIDEAELVHGLYHGTARLGLHTPAGQIDRLHGGDLVTVEMVRADLGAQPRRSGQLYIDYYRGRPLKIRLDSTSQQFDERLYDRDAGPGAAERVVAGLTRVAP